MKRFFLWPLFLALAPLFLFLSSCGGGGGTPVTTTQPATTTTTTATTTSTGSAPTTSTSTTSTTTVSLPFSVTGLQTGHGLNEDGTIIMPATVFTNVATVYASAATSNPTGSSKNVSFAWLRGGTAVATHSATVPTGSGRIADGLSYSPSFVPDGNYQLQIVYSGAVGAQVSFTVSSLLASLSGKITATGTTEPVASQRLWLMKDGFLHYSATSEANGDYIISGIAPNTYSLLLPNSKYYLSPEAVSITLSAEARNYDLSMEKRLTWEATVEEDLIFGGTVASGTVYNNGDTTCDPVVVLCSLEKNGSVVISEDNYTDPFSISPGSSAVFNINFYSTPTSSWDAYSIEVTY